MTCEKCRHKFVPLVDFYALLAFFVTAVESGTYYYPPLDRNSYSYSDISSLSEKDYDDLGNSLEDSLGPSAYSRYQSDSVGNELTDKRRYFDSYNLESDYYSNVYDEAPVLPKAAEQCKPETRSGGQVTVIDPHLTQVGITIAKSLKILLIIIAVLAIPAAIVHLILIPLKLLIGMKTLAVANAAALGAFATKYWYQHKHGTSDHGYGGESTINNNLPITQLISSIMNNNNNNNQQPNQWNNNCSCCNCGSCNCQLWGFPWWLYFGNNTNVQNNSNNNNNANSNNNTNVNTNTNTNNNNNNLSSHNKDKSVKSRKKLESASKEVIPNKRKMLDVYSALKPDDFKNMTKSDIETVLTFLKRKNKKVKVL
ncbi:putative uncharacterized protein DDB_G0279653 [Wyeomyia smithii]|uniref:putative uncharacterized protein DDB_G0279653 n=1 Tax=Wyeomyia smithii TaxID=174621 RepID=UPI002467BD5E|nr:putative uncharacterized protein DDB_G0279653 [Wyeomyia smithii]